MPFIAIVGCGPLGGALAHTLAARDRAAEVRLIDPAAAMAQGKALDIQQSGPVEQFRTRLTHAGSWAAVAGADVIVLADDGATGREHAGEAGLSVLREVVKSAGSAPLLFAGAGQRELMVTGGGRAQSARRPLDRQCAAGVGVRGSGAVRRAARHQWCRDRAPHRWRAAPGAASSPGRKVAPRRCLWRRNSRRIRSRPSTPSSPRCGRRGRTRSHLRRRGSSKVCSDDRGGGSRVSWRSGAGRGEMRRGDADRGRAGRGATSDRAEAHPPGADVARERDGDVRAHPGLRQAAAAGRSFSEGVVAAKAGQLTASRVCSMTPPAKSARRSRRIRRPRCSRDLSVCGLTRSTALASSVDNPWMSRRITGTR